MYFELIEHEIINASLVERIWIAHDAVPDSEDAADPAALLAQVDGEEVLVREGSGEFINDLFNAILDAIEDGDHLISVPAIVLDCIAEKGS